VAGPPRPDEAIEPFTTTDRRDSEINIEAAANLVYSCLKQIFGGGSLII
jgi:hypothetical protein